MLFAARELWGRDPDVFFGHLTAGIYLNSTADLTVLCGDFNAALRRKITLSLELMVNLVAVVFSRLVATVAVAPTATVTVVVLAAVVN